VTTRRTPASGALALEAWRLLDPHFERVLSDPSDLAARGAMLLGAHKAGAAIELSMLGATHACANPLTAHHGVAHGAAIAVMLPHVVRWNMGHVGGRYADLSDQLPDRLEALARAGGLATTLRALGVQEDSLETLASDAAKQWTGTFNPRPFDAAGALELYRRAF
jgi:alcohol dehydrogenase